MAFRAEANMTVFKKEVTFTFSGSDDGFMGEITFPDKFNIGDVMEGMWKAIAGDLDSYPFGRIDIEIERITGLMKEDKVNNQSIVAWSIVIGGIQLTVYFIKDTATNKQVKAFCIEPTGGIVIDSIPGVNVKLPDPISAAPKLTLADEKIEFSVAGHSFKFAKGFTAEASIKIPDIFEDELSYTYTPKKKTSTQTRSATPATTDKPAAVKWKKLDKKIGKVATIHRIGFLYHDKKLSLHLDMDAKMFVIEVGLINLQLKLDTTKFSMFKNFGKSKNKFSVVKKFMGEAISFGLDGLGVGIQTKAFTLAGLFTKYPITINKVVNGKKTAVTYQQYVGALVIKTKAFTAAGIGAYGKIDGYKSLFVYVFVGVPIGGPPFFFVEGLALGFGYNRQVKIPSIDKVADFPFVRIAMGEPDPDASVVGMLTRMVPIIVETFPPQEGSLFFAVGVKFNSYKLMNGFVLLIVSIGERLRIDVLGLLTLIMPKSKPVAAVELAIKVTIIPDTGFIGIEARITDNSYLFSKKAKLQGGFAFYIWSKDLSQDGYDISAGEFVLTLGGYHPRFSKPDYYPDVPRFGLNWRVTDNLTIKALCYFALTPVAVMAGLELSAVYDGSKFKAWFKLWADFLIQWSPFYYDIAAGIEIGFKYKCWSGELSASIHVWGPDFSGKAKVKICCFSKTISFGAGTKPATPKISWFKFKKELLPKTIMTSKMLDGMISESKEGDVPVYLVNPGTCTINVETNIPVSNITGVQLSTALSGEKFNLYPVGKKANAVVIVAVKNKANQEVNIFQAAIKDKNLPAALWSDKYNIGLNEKPTTLPKPVQLVLKAKSPKKGAHFPVTRIPPFDKSERDGIWSAESLGKITDAPKTHFGMYQEEYEETVNMKPNENTAEFFGLRANPIVI